MAERMPDFLAFMLQVFPGARFVFNTRDLDEVARSKWHARNPNARAELEIVEKQYVEALEPLGDRVYRVALQRLGGRPDPAARPVRLAGRDLRRGAGPRGHDGAPLVLTPVPPPTRLDAEHTAARLTLEPSAHSASNHHEHRVARPTRDLRQRRAGHPALWPRSRRGSRSVQQGSPAGGTMCAAATHRSIVIGVDGSSGSRTALRWGLREAERRRVPVLVAHAFGPSLRELKLGRGPGRGP